MIFKEVNNVGLSIVFGVMLLFACFMLMNLSSDESAATSGTDDYGDWTYYFDDTVPYASIVKYNGTEDNVVIPDYFFSSDCKVTTISAEAFKDNTSIVTVSMPSTVTNIGQKAFMNCTNLKSITIYDTSVPDYCFYGCTSLETVDGAELISVGNYSFYNCVSLKEINESNITSIGNHCFNSCQSLEDFNSTALITVGDYAFTGCGNLISFAFVSTIVSIGSYAFFDCINLESSIILNHSYTTMTNMKLYEDVGYFWDGLTYYDRGSNWFDNNFGLRYYYYTKYDFSQNVTVGTSAFGNCTSITTVQLSELVSVTDISISLLRNIGDYAFKGCTSLTTVSYDSTKINGSESITFGKGVFENCTALESVTVKKTGEEMFKGCTSLKNVTFTDQSTILEKGVFKDCVNLDNLTFNYNSTIKAEAFSGCSTLKYVTLPSNVSSIGENAFYGCTSLKNLTIESNTTTLGEGSFYNCTSLKNISLPSDSTYSNNIFSSTPTAIATSDSGTRLVKYVYNNSATEYVIPDEITTLADYAFANASNLEKITIPSTVTEIGIHVFDSCPSLKTIIWNAGTAVIPQYTFYNCDALVEYNVPLSIDTIDSYAFYDCSGLKKLTLNSNTKVINSKAFLDCVALTEVNLSTGLVSETN